MKTEDLDRIQKEIEELRHAIHWNGPFLREIVESRLFALLSLPMGFLMLLYFVASHFIVEAYGSYEAIPSAWKLVSVLLIALIFLAGVVGKWLLLSRRAAEIEKGATAWNAVKAMYSGASFNANAPAILCILVVSVFAVVVGHPWYIASTTAIFLGFACNGLATVVRRPEYVTTGWFSLAAGLASLFFIERSPYLWCAALWGGIFLVFGGVSLAATRSRESARTPAGTVDEARERR